jgi:hypothetical protein
MNYSYDNNIIQNALPIFNISLIIDNNTKNTQFIGWTLPISSKINRFIGLFYDNKLFYQEDLYALELASNHKNKILDSNNKLKTQGISIKFYVNI